MPDFDADKVFARNVPGTFSILQKKCVGIAGCGGLGSNVAVQLARTGIGKLIVADFDTVAIENLNRQHFFLDQVGMFKIDALEQNIRRINPEIEYIGHKVTLDESNIGKIFGQVDVMVEAFDKADQKVMLIETWLGLDNGKPIVVASGLSGYGKCDKIRIVQDGCLIVVGDQSSNFTEGLMAPRVTMVASMQANTVIEYLLEGAK